MIVEEQVDVGLLGAGLVAGIYVRMNGYQAQIFEQPISRAVYLLPTGNDYTIDAGIHFYMGFRPGQSVNRLYRELGIFQAD